MNSEVTGLALCSELTNRRIPLSRLRVKPVLVSFNQLLGILRMQLALIIIWVLKKKKGKLRLRRRKGSSSFIPVVGVT